MIQSQQIRLLASEYRSRFGKISTNKSKSKDYLLMIFNFLTEIQQEKGRYMGQKDISEKILVDYNDVFADIVNVCAFKGEEIVKQEDLENTSVYSQYKAEDGKLHEEERDVAKYWKRKKTAIALYGIENQSTADKNMPFRIIGYDGAAYRSQLLDKRKRIVPVASFVLYFGTEKRWDKKKSIKELVKIPEGLEEYVNDYKVNVIEVAWLSDEQLKQFKSDFGIVANYFVQKRKNKDYVPNDTREIQHVDAVLKLLSVMTGDKRYGKILYGNDEKGEVKTMCEVVDRLVKMGKSEGENEERLRIIQKKLEKGMNVEEIAELLELPVEDVKKLIE